MSASPGVTLTGTIRDISGNPVAGAVTATLSNYGGNSPTIAGDSELAPIQISATANGSGVWTLTLWGSDQISPSNTIYTISITPAGSNAAQWIEEYLIKSGSYNLANLTPLLSIPPMAVPPQASVPGGANTDVQINNNGAFGADPRFTFNPSTGIFDLSGTTQTNLSPTVLIGKTAGISSTLTFQGQNSGAVQLQASPNAGSPRTLALPTLDPLTGQVWMGVSGAPNASFWATAATTRAQVDLTAQTAAIGTINLLAAVSVLGGQYRVSWNAKVTTAAGVSSTLGPLTITYIDPDNVTQTITCAAQSKNGAIETTDTGNSTTTVLLGLPILLNVKPSTIISYAMGYASSAAAAMNYNLHINIESFQG